MKEAQNRLTLGIFVIGMLTLIGISCDRADVPDAFVKGPYLQNVQLNSITIMWETDKPTVGTVEYWNDTIDRQRVSDTGATLIHEITLSGLVAETEYGYRVVTADGKSRDYSFRTAVRENTPFIFAAYGDNKSGPFMHQQVANLILSKRPYLAMHVGDLVDRGGIKKQWNKLFFGPAREMMHEIPVFPALGNHEDHADNYFNFFSLPGDEQWYSFDFGNAHFIVLDTDKDFLEEGDQISWLIVDLENNAAEWTFVFFHHPPFTSGGNHYRKDRIYRKNLLHPILEKYGVDVVFNGHDHHYERIKPIVSRGGTHPVTYIVCGNGGTGMRFTRKLDWTAYIERVFGFTLISIDGQRMHLQSINIHDEVIDELVLDKSDQAMMDEYYATAMIFEDIDDKLEVGKMEREADHLMDDGNYAEAVERAWETITLDSSCVEAWAIVANSEFELDHLEKAREAAEQSIKILPAHTVAYKVLAKYYLKKKDFPTAMEYCRQRLAAAPDSPGGYEQMADIWLEQGDTDRAIDVLKLALELLPSDSDILFDLAELYEETGSAKLAYETYKQGVEWYMEESEDDDVRDARRFISDYQAKGR